MSLNTLLPPWLLSSAQRLAQSDGHAWLLAGAPGLGQWILAQTVARAWLCEQPASEGLACGQCPSCLAMDSHTHPDLHVLLPDELALQEQWPLDPKLLDKLEKKEVKPSKWIRVDSVRAMLGFAQTTASRGRGKVVLVYPAQRLNIESANALLKVLEEPAQGLRFLLVTEAAHQLLPTIRSRCLSHVLAWPSVEQVLPWLEHALDAPDQAQGWLRLAGGLPYEALALAQTGVAYHDIRQWPRHLHSAHPAALSVLSALSPSTALSLLQKVAHDALLMAHRLAPRYFEADTFPDRLDASRIGEWSQALMNQKTHVEHPFQAALMHEAWLDGARTALKPH